MRVNHNYTKRERDLVEDIENLIRRGLELEEQQVINGRQMNRYQELEDIIEQLEKLSNKLHHSDFILKDLTIDYITDMIEEFKDVKDTISFYKHQK